MDGHKGTLLCQLGNIALRIGDALDIDAETGKIRSNNRKAMAYWDREYEPGWKPRL